MNAVNGLAYTVNLRSRSPGPPKIPKTLQDHFTMLPRPKPPRQETQTGPSSYCWHVPSPALISSTSATRGVWVSPSLRHQTRPPRETGTRHHDQRKKRHALDRAKEEG
ncbi:hypothetical protein CMEL01_00768 [Colletotrichum melonis]|uniref:Uncharacterized protein n=1 Tax=Colletotrichum melonis TaxID=1209925 RepID=A0AAI9XYP1_9PEZI|nr:hypothetical protein CMEL01_00768 [Colletotrichum melonis]